MTLKTPQGGRPCQVELHPPQTNRSDVREPANARQQETEATVGGGGRAPVCKLVQLGRPMPLLASRTLVDSCNSPMQRCALPSKASITALAMTGRRACIMGNASAHDAQNAPNVVLDAEWRPKPPSRMGSVATSCATSCCCDSPRPPSNLAMNSCGWHGSQEMVAPRPGALKQQVPCALQIWDTGDCPPQFLFFFQSLFCLPR